MVGSDRERWDRKFGAGEGPAHFRVNDLLLDHRHLLGGGRALDLACGFGGNALYLAAAGYDVDAVDVSGVALARARSEALRRGLKLRLVQADLTRWWVPRLRYDVIVVFYYVNRGLVPRLAEGLRPGGLLFLAQRNRRMLKQRPTFDPAYVVEAGELRRLAEAARLEVVFSSDDPPGGGHNSSLIARRPATS
jgi:SAM-dependent methyltransferase